MEDMAAMILGGGVGSRLYPLTRDRSKPAVPIAGKYRLIDIPISNCINADVRAIYILTMYQSASLNNHVSAAYRFDQFSRGFVQVFAAQQSAGIAAKDAWFQGTADAVRKCMFQLRNIRAKHVLVLSGDHLYRMNYREFRDAHLEAEADFTVAVKPVGRQEASEFGILKVDPDPAEKGRIVEFVEKPKTPEQLDALKTDTTVFGLTPEEAEKKPYLASMGIYLFQSPVLKDLVDGYPEMNDFGKEIIPAAIKTRHVHAYCFDGYWADIGTIRAFFEANLDLVNPMPQFNLFDPESPVYTNQRFLPGAKLNQAHLNHSIVCEGAIVDDATVQRSILGVRARGSRGARLENCLVMGADYYQPGGATPVIGIGEGSHLQNAIVDKNASIGPRVQLLNRDNLEKYDDPEGRFYVRDHIIVVAKNSIIPADLSF